MRRKLGSVENAFTINGIFAPLAAVSILHLQPGPTPEAVRQALPILQRRHPFLRARLTKAGRVYFFDFPESPQPIPLLVLPRQNDSSWQAAATAELNREIGQGDEPLLRLTYLVPAEPDGPADLIFTFHHSIVDASSGLKFQEVLLGLCDPDGDGPSSAPKSTALLPASDDRFPAPYQGFKAVPHKAAYLLRQMIDEIQYRWRARGTPKPPIYRESDCAILSRSLDAHTTAELVNQSRRNRITLNSLTSAAMLLAVHKLRYAGQPLPLRPIMFGNLRPYLDPPMAAEWLGCMVTMLRYTVPLTDGMDIWQLAAVLQQKHTTATKRGEKFLAAAFTSQIVKMTLQLKAFRLGTTAVSYAGPLPLQDKYGPFQVTGLHNFVSNNVLGPEFAAAAHILFGELVWNFLYMVKDMNTETAEAIAAETCRLLVKAAESGPA